MIGTVVGNYKILDKIGEGGMGAVFKGVDLMLEREVAIKMLRPELARQPNIVERFRTEAVTLAKLNHPNVATLHSFFRQGEDFFMVMEFVRGETLDDVIRGRGAMPCDHAVELFCMALEGIDHAHKMGIVHRDIKPANMMLTDTGSIKVMDFGIARVLGTDRLTKTGHLIGTIEYMSPEQVRGEETDARSDIYSLGILLYEMLTGRVPFHSTSEYELMRSQIEEAPTPPRAFAAHIPIAVEQAIMRALAKKREARYQSAGELRSTLMQRTSGLVTMPLQAPAARTGGEAEAVTRIMETPTKALPSAGVAKETRLAGDPGFAAAGASGQLKETRIGEPAAMSAYAETEPGYYAPQTAASTAAAGASFLSKLTWKHFAGAGVALVAIFAVTFALISGGSKPEPSTTVPPPATSSSPPPPTQSAPPPQAEPMTSPSVAPPDSQPAAANAAPAGSAAVGRSRDARSQKNAETAPVTAGAPPVPQPSQAQPSATPPKQDKVASTKPDAKKQAEKTEEKKDEKKRGIGGFFKKVFGGGDKNKNEKKP